MVRQRVDLTGLRFGSWVVLHRLASGYWLCRCRCGTKRPVSPGNLKRGASTRCKACGGRHSHLQRAGQ